MDATAIVSVIAALVAAAVSVYTARANRHRVKAEAADAISDAAVQLVEPLRCENLALRAEVQKLRAEVQKLRDDVTALQRENEALLRCEYLRERQPGNPRGGYDWTEGGLRFLRKRWWERVE